VFSFVLGCFSRERRLAHVCGRNGGGEREVGESQVEGREKRNNYRGGSIRMIIFYFYKVYQITTPNIIMFRLVTGKKREKMKEKTKMKIKYNVHS